MLRLRPALVATLLVAGACAPSNDVAIGLKDYPTDVVYGDPSASTTEVTLPPVVGASLSPGFPGFLVPAPPPPPVADGPGELPPFPDPPRTVEFLPDPCPIADPKSTPVAAGPKIVGTPPAGTFTYKQRGTSKVGTGAAVVLPEIGERTIKNVKLVDGEPTWDVEIVEFGVTTTTSYRVDRPAGRSELDGLYITRIVQVAPGRAPDEFTPVQPGLRIFPEPAAVGAQWASVGTDPARALSMTLQGTLKELRTVDVCGVLVETWVTDVAITVRRPGLTAGDEFTTTATYLVSTALGSLLIADTVTQKGTDDGLALDRSTSSQLIDLAPR